MLLFVLFVAIVPSVKSSACTLGQHCPSCTETTGDCQEDCYVGYFGRRCNNRCSIGCRNKACRLSREGTGVCTQGCIPGYHGSTCRAPCLQSPGCHRCSMECEEGYCQEDKTCFASCQDSFYGANCTSCASSCKRCNRATGQCEECEQGYGGTDCTLHCKNCIGQCRGGCSGRCRSEYFGKFCENSCSEGCSSDCDINTGDCVCKPGWYGKDCRLACNVNCHGGLCDEDGNCLDGCNQGYFGDRCSSPCNKSCINVPCGQELCSKCVHGEAVCLIRCKKCFNNYKPENVCTGICASNCSRSECGDETLVTLTEKDHHHSYSSTPDNSVTVTTLAATAVVLVMIVVVLILYLACYFKRLREMIYGNVEPLRRLNSVERSPQGISHVESHEYAEVAVDLEGMDDEDVRLQMPFPADVCGVAAAADGGGCDDDDDDDDDGGVVRKIRERKSNRTVLYENISLDDSFSYIHPVYVSSLQRETRIAEEFN